MVNTDLSIIKVDAQTRKPLNGAKFRLEQYDKDYRECLKTWDEVEVSSQEGEEGTLRFEDLGVGYYKLVETKCPDGYIKKADDPRFSISPNTETGLLEVHFTDGSGTVTYNTDTKKTVIFHLLSPPWKGS